jgi:hypothetical protein
VSVDESPEASSLKALHLLGRGPRVTLEWRFSAREAKAPAGRWRYAKIGKGASGTLAVRDAVRTDKRKRRREVGGTQR